MMARAGIKEKINFREKDKVASGELCFFKKDQSNKEIIKIGIKQNPVLKTVFLAKKITFAIPLNSNGVDTA